MCTHDEWVVEALRRLPAVIVVAVGDGIDGAGVVDADNGVGGWYACIDGVCVDDGGDIGAECFGAEEGPCAVVDDDVVGMWRACVEAEV